MDLFYLCPSVLEPSLYEYIQKLIKILKYEIEQTLICTSVKFKHLESSNLLLTLKYLSCLNSFSNFSNWLAE